MYALQTVPHFHEFYLDGRISDFYANISRERAYERKVLLSGLKLYKAPCY